MIKREQELLEQIADALTIEDGLSNEERFGSVFSALFELDKIQLGQTKQLSDEQLKEVNSKAATKKILKEIADTVETDNADIKAVRSILIHVLKRPEVYGLSKKTSSFFLQFCAGTSIENEVPIALNTLLLKEEWMVRNILQTKDLGANAETAQIFVDALRKGDYAVTAGFGRWLIKKYSDPLLNPDNKVIDADNIHPLVAYELAHTDISPEDLPALLTMYDHTKAENSYTANLMISGIHNLMNQQVVLRREYPQGDSLQVMRQKHKDFLIMDKPVRKLIDEGLYFEGKDAVNLGDNYQADKITAFAKENRDSIATNLIVLNTQQATPDQITVLLALKDEILQYIEHLENHPPENPELTYTNRLKAANEMLEILQKGGTIKENIIIGITDQASIIASNKPDEWELNWLGKNRDSFTTRLIMLNTQDATPDHIIALLRLKDEILQYISDLESQPPESPQQTYTNRLQAAYEMLEILQKGGTIKEDIIPKLSGPAHIIANNKPDEWELIWLKNSRDSFTTRLIMLNTQDATPDHINALLRLKDEILHYISDLEAHPPENPQRPYINRLQAAYKMLELLQKGGILKEDFIPKLSAQAQVIANNNPNHGELAWLNNIREFFTSRFIELNTQKATLEDINTLLAVKDQILRYIGYLEKHPPEKAQETYTNRLAAANKMLEILQKGGTIKEDIIPQIKAQAQVIANNKPGLWELGFLGWLQSFFDQYKPAMSKETSETLKAIDAIVESKKQGIPLESINPNKEEDVGDEEDREEVRFDVYKDF